MGNPSHAAPFALRHLSIRSHLTQVTPGFYHGLFLQQLIHSFIGKFHQVWQALTTRERYYKTSQEDQAENLNHAPAGNENPGFN